MFGESPLNTSLLSMDPSFTSSAPKILVLLESEKIEN
jgi:hypothetical protein